MTTEDELALVEMGYQPVFTDDFSRIIGWRDCHNGGDNGHSKDRGNKTEKTAKTKWSRSHGSETYPTNVSED